MPNPFEKGGREAGGTAQPEALTDLCPFFGLVCVPRMPERQLLAPGQIPFPVPEVVSHPCIGEQCAMWDKDSGDCIVRMGFRVLPDIAKNLAPLQNFFGKR